MNAPKPIAIDPTQVAEATVEPGEAKAPQSSPKEPCPAQTINSGGAEPPDTARDVSAPGDGVFRDIRERPNHPGLEAMPALQLPVADYGVVSNGEWPFLVEHKSLPDLYFLALHDHERRRGQAELARQFARGGIRVLLVDVLPGNLARWNQIAASKALTTAGLPQYSVRPDRVSVVVEIGAILREYEDAGWVVVLKPEEQAWAHFGDYIMHLIRLQQDSDALAVASQLAAGQAAWAKYKGLLAELQNTQVPSCVKRLQTESGLAEFGTLSSNFHVSRSTACELLKLYAAARKEEPLDPPRSGEDLIREAQEWGHKQGLPHALHSRTHVELQRIITEPPKSLGCITPARRTALVKYGLCHKPGSCTYGCWRHGSVAEHRQLAGSALAAISGFQESLETVQKLIDFAEALKGVEKLGYGLAALDVPAAPALNAIGIRQRKTLERRLGIAMDWGLIARDTAFKPKGGKQRIRLIVHLGLFGHADSTMLNWHMALYQTLLKGSSQCAGFVALGFSMVV